jgi:hypothetical protein
VGVGITVAVRKQVVAPTFRSAPAAREGGGVVGASSTRPKAERRSALQNADLK